MELLRRRSPDRNWSGSVELLFIALALSQFSNASVQPVIFVYDGIYGVDSYTVPTNPSAHIVELQQDNITCLGDFYAGNGYTNLAFPLSTSRVENEQDVVGRCLYRNPIQLQQANKVTSFSTMFQVSINSELVSTYSVEGYCVPGDESVTASGTLQGLAFIISSDTFTAGDGGGYLGWLNSSTNDRPGHNFAVEIDFFRDLQFQDPVGIHLGVDSNSLISVKTSTQPSWPTSGIISGFFKGVTLWIDYDGYNQNLNIFASMNSSKPAIPTLSTPIDLSEELSQEDMFVGFSGSISNVTISGNTTQELLAKISSPVPSYYFGYSINAWSFNSNGKAPDLPRGADGFVQFPGSEAGKRLLQKIVIISVTIPVGVTAVILTFVVVRLGKRNARLMAMAKKYQIEEDLLEQGPQTFKYKTLSLATKKFSSRQLLGSGGFGSVYRGTLKGKGTAERPTDVAVKRISATSKQGAREFLAEVKVIGQAQHRNLVRLLGWCHERGELLLVYDFMPNGSVDQHLFKDSEREPVLTWARRLKILSGVATALAYLHDEWEQRVIHRDVKSSNVMLDRDFNARLGDFGLARLSKHGQAPQSTAVLAGTFGYLAPEAMVTFKFTEKTDVYAFGAMVLEMATGKRPVLNLGDQTTSNARSLVDWVWGLYRDDTLLEAADCRIKSAYDPGEIMTVLKIGLLCSHPDPDERPTMREVLNIWKGSTPFPPVPRTKPTPVFISTLTSRILDGDSTLLDTYDTLDINDSSHSGAWRDGKFTLDLDKISQSAPIMPMEVFGDSSESEIDIDERANVRWSPGLRCRRCNANPSLPISLPL